MTFCHQLVELFQTVGMEALQEVHPLGNAGEWGAVTGQYEVNV